MGPQHASPTRQRASGCWPPGLSSEGVERVVYEPTGPYHAAFERAFAGRIREDRVLARTFAILCSIPGIGAVSAAALLIELPEIGTLNRKQVASLAGLAPMTRQSGNWRGRAFIQGGRKHLRDALYMPALVAMRVNPDLKAKYDQLIGSG